jgi:4a-hydroxytetrahydrobiopterin dehydratase
MSTPPRAPPARLDPAARAEALAGLREWTYVQDRDALHRRFVFAGFVEAFAFMTAVAGLAEARGHHPEWTNVYNRVDVLWTTHDCGGLSALDVELAAALDELYRATRRGEE